ncbi:MAG: methyltransferase domain-containing protein [Planctomycetaceae bacterium]
MPVKYDFGCGQNKHSPDHIGVDAWDGNNPDICVSILDTQRMHDLIRSNSADEIVCKHVFEHLPHDDDWKTAMRQMARILRPGGRFEIRVPHPAHDDAMIHGHRHVFTPQFWRAMQDGDWLAGELVITHIEEVPNPEAVALCDAHNLRFTEWSKLLRNTFLETCVTGYKP